VTNLSPQDRIEILELIANYAYSWDGRDADGFSKLFTEDAIRDNYIDGETSPRSRLQSRAELRQHASESFGGRLVGVHTRHHQTNTVLIHVATDRATGKTMFLLTHQRSDEAVPRLMGSGVYEDEFVKLEGSWKFARRTAHVVGGLPQAHVASAP
jgi:SnoaL-like domain